MNIVNIMNFVRAVEPRSEEMQSKLYVTTEKQIDLVKRFQFENTFLLQYDAFIRPDYQALFQREKDDRMELGLWYEIVRPLTQSVGIEWRGRQDWDWDWHVVPGFSMGYSVEERKLLADEAMRKFKEVFGYYPRSIGSWLLDTFTMEYLSENYEVDMFCICRDQLNTDAYNLIGGYFNQAYYPSKNNMFCPAQTAENALKTPVFRLLSPCPVHNYDGVKYIPNGTGNVFTLEPAWPLGRDPKCFDWFCQSYFGNENMGFGYMQLGQENSFGYDDIMDGLEMQFEKLAAMDNVSVMKMSDTGSWFKRTYAETPPTSVIADRDWADTDCQSAYYDCKNYTANLFYREGKLYLRALYLFREAFCEAYLNTACDNWYATYENLPVMDTLIWGKDTDQCGLFIENANSNFVCHREEKTLIADAGEQSVAFSEDKIIFTHCTLRFQFGAPTAEINAEGNTIQYHYRGFDYSIRLSGTVRQEENDIIVEPTDNQIVVYLAE